MGIDSIHGIGVEADGAAIVLHCGDGETFRIEPSSDLVMGTQLLAKVREILARPIVEKGGFEVLGLPIHASIDDWANQFGFWTKDYGPLISKVTTSAVRQAPAYMQKVAEFLRGSAAPGPSAPGGPQAPRDPWSGVPR